MKRFLYLLCALAFCLALTPSTALAAAPNGQVIYVGNENVTNGGYWTTSEDGQTITSVGDSQPSSGGYIHYDADNNTLTLHNATIKKELDYNENITGGTYICGAAIGVFNQKGAAELTITLEGTNTIAEVSMGIFVLASSESTGSSSLTITGDGSLDASGSSNPAIIVQSNSSNAELNIENAKVTATIVDSYGSDGVRVQSEENSSASLTVDGGSLTATGSGATFAGIQLQFGSGGSVSGTPTVTVGYNAIIRANGGIANNSTNPIQFNGNGIVFDGNTGTVHGNVTLQNPLTIEQGETLTIPEDSTLNTNNNLTNNGIIVNTGGTLNGEPGGNGTTETAPIITTDSLPNGTVGQYYDQTLHADGGNITWSATGLPAGLTLDANGTINGTPTANGQFPVNVTAKNSAGEASKEYKLTIESATVPVTGVTLDKTELSLIVDGTAKLDATVEPNDATNKNVTWSSDNDDVATVDADGNVKAVAPGTATITATAGGKTATCTVTVTAKTYTVSVTPSSIDFGSECPDYTQPDAQSVTITNTGNQTVEVTLPAATGYTITGSEGFANGIASIEPEGAATFTVRPNSNLPAGTYDETLTVYGTTVTVRFTVGHEWGEPAWTWDGTTATATFTCAECGETRTVDAAVTSTATTDPTCTENGVTEYTATATLDGTTYTATKNVADIPATGHEWGEDGHCTICDAVKPGFMPEIIQGDKATWTKGGGQPLSFMSNAAYADFQEARVDGQTLDPAHYTVEQGSTIVTLKAAYLESLDPGEHTLDIVSSTGTATATFTITAKETQQPADTQQPAKPADTDRSPAKSAGDGGQLSRGGSDIMPAVATLAILMASGLVLGTFVLRRGRR